MQPADVTRLSLKYGGQPDEIDAGTLLQSLTGIISLLEEINADLETGEKIEIKVQAPAPGSFILTLALYASFAATTGLFTIEHAAGLKAIVETLISLLNLRKALRKEAPKSIEEQGTKVKITTVNGDVTIYDRPTFNLYVRESGTLDEVFSALEEDPNVDGFEVLGPDDKPLFIAGQNEIQEMSEGVVPSLTPTQEAERIVPVPKANLVVLRASFSARLTWDFVYNDIKITAKVDDEKFLDRITKGLEKFGAGNILVAALEIAQVFNPSANIYVNKRYRVTHIYANEERPTQTDLFK